MQGHIQNIKNGIFRSNQVIKSKYNENDYLYKQLKNGLKYLLVKDTKTDKSSAAFCVNIGSLNDPENFQGLAHFLEHMVFMGTKPYPGENEYNDFLSKNSGYSNAYTEFNKTTYYFESSNEAFVDSFKMTSRFFIDPLLNESSVDREINAVDSEFKNCLREDSEKYSEIMNKEANNGTPFNKFMCGNLDTLKKPETLDALKIFFEKHYSADIISCVIYSNYDLNILEDIVDEILLEIPNKNLLMEKTNRSKENIRNYVFNNKYAFDKTNNGMFYKIAGIMDKDILNLEWVLNLSYDEYYKKKPLEYIINLLGAKGPESLICNLIKDNLISDGGCSMDNYANTFTKVIISLELTDDGFDNYTEVIKRVLNSLEKLKNLPIKKNFFNELKKMWGISFDFHVDDNICDFTAETASTIHDGYEPDHILIGDFLMEEFDSNLIKYFFDFLTNENLNISLVSNSFEKEFKEKKKVEISPFGEIFNHKMDIEIANEEKKFVEIRNEKIFDTNYTLEKINFEKLDLKNFAFNGFELIDYPKDNNLLPENYNFITKVSEIKNENSKIPPKKIFENDHYSLIYKKDNAFFSPIIIMQGKIYFENFNIKRKSGKIFSVEEMTCYLGIWFTLLSKEFKERNYISDFAGFYFEFFNGFNEISLRFIGYNDLKKYEEFIKFTFEYFIELHKLKNIENFKTKMLTIITEEIKNVKNLDYFSASGQAGEKFRELSLKYFCKNKKQIEIYENMKKMISEDEDFSDFSEFVANYLNSTYIHWLVQGHIDPLNALEIVKYFSSKIQKQENFSAFKFQENNKNEEFEYELLKENENHSMKNGINSKVFNKNNSIGNEMAKYKPGNHYYHSFNSIDEKNENSAIISYFLLGKLNIKQKCICLLLQTMLSDEFFDDLRTQQCLGYSVSFYLNSFVKIDAFCCLVESSVKPPEYITNRITKFLHENNPKNEKNDEEYKDDFKKYKASIINDLKKKDYILINEFERNYHEISSREYAFEKNIERVKIIEKLTLDEVAKFYEEVFIRNPTRVDIGFVSKQMIEENSKILNENFEKNYKDIVKTDEDKKEEDEEMEEENEDEELSSSISEKSFELPMRIKIEDDSFKHDLDTYNYNML